MTSTPWRERIPAVLLGAALLSACSGGFQSPAAVVNGRRISQAELQGQLDARFKDATLRAQVSAPGGDQVEKDLTRRLLAFLIERQLIRDYARSNGIGVSSSEVDARMSQIVAQTGGQAAFEQQLRAQHTTIAQVRESAELELLVEKIEARLALGGPNATQAQRNQAFLDWLRAQFLRAHVQVNPRFGRFDVTNLQVVAITSTEG